MNEVLLAPAEPGNPDRFIQAAREAMTGGG
jgi:hypothetical protein